MMGLATGCRRPRSSFVAHLVHKVFDRLTVDSYHTNIPELGGTSGRRDLEDKSHRPDVTAQTTRL